MKMWVLHHACHTQVELRHLCVFSHEYPRLFQIHKRPIKGRHNESKKLHLTLLIYFFEKQKWSFDDAFLSRKSVVGKPKEEKVSTFFSHPKESVLHLAVPYWFLLYTISQLMSINSGVLLPYKSRQLLYLIEAMTLGLCLSGRTLKKNIAGFLCKRSVHVYPGGRIKM